MTTDRQSELRAIRKLVRGIGRVRRVWRLSLAELRSEAGRLIADRREWLTPSEFRTLADFTREVGR